MKNKFALGAIAGMSTLALAVPAIAQIAGAQTAASSSATGVSDTATIFRPAPKQMTVEELIARDDAFLANIDTFVALQKSAMMTHRAALAAAASITDTTEQRAAVRAAHEAMRTTIQGAIAANPDFQFMMKPFGGHGGRGGHHGHKGPKMMLLAEKLGMTEAELKAAIDGGKTIEQIAAEKGITLPAHPAFGEKMMGNPASSAQ